MGTDKELRALWAHCQMFFKEQRIGCAETVCQSDCVIENAYEFIEGIGDIIGWYDDETKAFVKDEA